MTYVIEINRIHKAGDKGDVEVKINGDLDGIYADKYELIGNKWYPTITDEEVMRTSIMSLSYKNGRPCRW